MTYGFQTSGSRQATNSAQNKQKTSCSGLMDSLNNTVYKNQKSYHYYLRRKKVMLYLSVCLSVSVCQITQKIINGF